MADLRISDLVTASQLKDDDYYEIAQSESGTRVSYKTTLLAIAVQIATMVDFTSDLNTTSKKITGAINELKQLISLIPQFSIEVVEELPTEDISDTTIYLVPAEDPEVGNYYEEYIYVNNTWELVGTTAVDLSGYYTKLEVDGLLATKASVAEVELKENKTDMPTDVRTIIKDCKTPKSATITNGIAQFECIEENLVKGLKVTMNPIQDLHGYSNPWAGGAGKNKLQNTATSATVVGVTYTVNSDGTIIANGTATANSNLYIYGADSSYVDIGIGAGNYIMNGGNTNSIFYVIRRRSGTNTNFTSRGEDVTIDIEEGDTFRVMVRVGSGVTVNNELIKPMIRLSSVTDATFAPYSNICPISGRTEASVTRTAGEDVETHTHQYSDTIYGGVDDFVNGGLENEWGYIAEYDGETLPGEWISDRDVYAPDTTPTTGAEVAYKLATPTTIPTSAEEIATVAGTNIISGTEPISECKYTELATVDDLIKIIGGQ